MFKFFLQTWTWNVDDQVIAMIYSMVVAQVDPRGMLGKNK